MPSPRTVPNEPAALVEIWADIRRVSSVLGVPERGVQLVTRLRSRVEAVASRAAQQPPGARAACIVDLEPPAAAGGWVADLLVLAGAVDPLGPAGDGVRPLDPATLAQSDPDLLILAPTGCDLSAALRQAHRLAALPAWAGLRAVRNGRVFAADGIACFGRPGPHVAETLEVIAEILHPAAFRFGHEGTAWARLENGAG
jgi:iron complex transport system substrate-binding protein